jgi:hypothetical protein
MARNTGPISRRAASARDGARALMQRRLPLSAPEALRIGLVDRCFDVAAGDALRCGGAGGSPLAASYNLRDLVMRKQTERAADEAERPLADYRQEELSRMHRNFYGFDPSYHVARYHFVHKLPHAWTPRHLAVHREAGGRCDERHAAPAHRAGGRRRGAFAGRDAPHAGRGLFTCSPPAAPTTRASSSSGTR